MPLLQVSEPFQIPVPFPFQEASPVVLAVLFQILLSEVSQTSHTNTTVLQILTLSLGACARMPNEGHQELLCAVTQ